MTEQKHRDPDHGRPDPNPHKRLGTFVDTPVAPGYHPICRSAPIAALPFTRTPNGKGRVPAFGGRAPIPEGRPAPDSLYPRQQH
jgi:hypothetical protein